MFDTLRARLATWDRSADDYMQHAEHILPGVAAMDDGSHLAMLRLEGKPLALMDDAQRYAERTRRHGVLRALADANVQIYEHLVSHEGAAPWAPNGFRSAYGAALSGDYHRAIGAGMLRRDWFISILAKPSAVQGWFGFGRRGRTRTNVELVQQVEDRCAMLLDALPDYRPVRLATRKASGMEWSEIGEALRLILYGRWQPVAVPAGRLADVVYTEQVIAGLRGFEVLGAGSSRFGMMFGLTEYTESAPPRMLDPVLAAPLRFVLTNSYQFQSRGKVMDTLGPRVTQMFNTADRAVSLATGLGTAMDDIASGRGLHGDHHFSVAVHVDDFAELPAAARRMNALLVNCGLAVAPERWGCEPAVFAQVPGSAAWLKARHGGISGYNFASFSSLSGEPAGGGEEKWGAAVLRLRTATGAAHDLHLHVNGVGHFLAFGPIGGGKTVMLGLIGAHLEPLVAPKGGLVCFLDADGSNELTVRACGGPYTIIRRGVDSGMAPWKALENTPDNCAWLIEFTIGLITSDGGPLPSPQQQDAIKFGVRFLMRQRPGLRSFAALRQFLEWKESGAGERLGRWCKGGALGWAFDGEADVLRFDAHIAGIDNSALLTDDATTVCEPMAAYQFHRIGERVGTGVPGAVLVDEAQAYLPGARYAAGFERFVTRLRKGNGLIGLAMQQPQAILGHRIGQSFISNAPTKLLFPNVSAEIAAYRDGIHCTEGELAAVRESMAQHGRGTFLVKRDNGSFIARADLSGLPDHIAILSADPNRRALAHRIMEEVGADPVVWVPVYRRRYKEAA